MYNFLPGNTSSYLSDLCYFCQETIVVTDQKVYYCLPGNGSSYLSHRQNGRRYHRVLAVCALLTRVILKGLTLRKFVFDVCVCMFYVCEVICFVV